MLLAPGNPSLARSGIGFFSKYAALLDIMLRVGDLAIVTLTGLAVYALRFGTLAIDEPYLSGIILAVLLTLLIFPASNIYRSWRGESLAVEVIRVWLAWIGVLMTLFALSWMMKTTESYSRLWVFGWSAGGMALFVLSRFGARRFLRFIRRRGVDIRKVILVGTTHAGQKMVEAARNNAWMGLEVIGYVETEYDQVSIDNLPRLGSLDEFLDNMVTAGNYEQLWIALPMRAEQNIRRVTDAVSHTTATIRLIPDLFGYELLNQQTSELAGVPVITLRGSRIDGHARVLKAVEDRVLAALILFFISPLMVIIAIGIKLSSPGPVFFKQKRHGLNGKEVEVWKFRSMRIHKESGDQVTQARKDDPRVTRFGRFLRKTSLDELPQFINVLMGTMSIVGPRPHAIEHNKHYRQLIKDYTQRNYMKPGITGWAQVNGFRGETSTVERMADRISYDMMYIKNWSLWFDVRIILSTIAHGFIHKNAY